MPSMLQDVVGVAAGACSMTSFVPQIVKILRQRDAAGVSLHMYMVTVTGFVLWTAYGVLQHSWPIWLSNAINLSLAGTILALRVRYGGADHPAGG